MAGVILLSTLSTVGLGGWSWWMSRISLLTKGMTWYLSQGRDLVGIFFWCVSVLRCGILVEGKAAMLHEVRLHM